MSDLRRVIIQFTELAKVKTSKTWYLRKKCHREGCLKTSLKEAEVGDFPEGPGVKTWPSNAGG